MASGVVSGRSLSGERAQRIVEAMRCSVARHGIREATFDRVAREAGVSRGLLHYYFGTKEQLLIEAARRDCELRMESVERRLSAAGSAEAFIDMLAEDLQATVREDPDFLTMLFELFALARHNQEIAVEYAALMHRTREQVARMLAAAHAAKLLKLHAEPEAVVEVMFSIADGLALRMLAEPARDFSQTVSAAITCARALLAD